MDEEIGRILEHPLFRKNMERCVVYEKDREFCHHDMTHALNVARICYILVLEQKLPYRRELVYAAALLHDIGRAAQYVTGESHHRMGSQLAGKILADAGFSSEDIRLVQDIIERHCSHLSAAQVETCRKKAPETLLEAFDLADFWSRRCPECVVRSECYWEIKSDVLER